MTDVTIDKPTNLKEANANHIFKITIRDRVHFYKIVECLNTNVGKGTIYWTMEGRVLRNLKEGKARVTKVYVFKEDFDESSSLYLNLL